MRNSSSQVLSSERSLSTRRKKKKRDKASRDYEGIKVVEKILNKHYISCFNKKKEAGWLVQPRQSESWSTGKRLKPHPGKNRVQGSQYTQGMEKSLAQNAGEKKSQRIKSNPNSRNYKKLAGLRIVP